MRTGERGFTLLELTICVGILAAVSAATAGAFAALAHSTAPPAARDAALDVAENALARARAAAAYAPSAASADRTWALVPGTTQSVAGGQLVGAAPCGSPAPRALALPTSTTFDPSQQRFTVVVTYPRDACAVAPDGSIAPANAASVTLSGTLPPPVYAPGTTVYRDVATPARM